jgi:Icc-related predicted phosphoesterase
MKFKVVAISDTHNRKTELPEGDLLIHSGDFTVHGFRIELYRQMLWLESQRHKFKYGVVTLGNHDLYGEEQLEELRAAFADIGYVLLHNETYTLPNGLKLWGSAHTPEYHDWAFMLKPGPIFDAWEKIPLDTDILFTHGPPAGILDKSYRGPGIGCPHLLTKVQEVKPKLMCFGHAHEGHGVLKTGDTLFVNAAVRFEVVELDLDDNSKIISAAHIKS